LIRACLQHNPGLKRFILLSSQAAAGPGLTNEKKNETDPCRPVSPYGESKRMAEEFCLKFSDKIPLTILRPSAVYGPRDRDFYTQFKIIAKKIKPELKNQIQKISLCYVADVIQALWLAAQTPVKSGEIFFLSDGYDYRLPEIGDTFEKALNVKAFCLPVPKSLVSLVGFFSHLSANISGNPALLHPGRVKEMAQKNWLCDMSKAGSMLGFNPQFDLMRGAALTVAWYKKQNWL
ncbi:MAG: NAD(P)-dependent oxidoreductase, partial [Desulfobacteraceae bacterium]